MTDEHIIEVMAMAIYVAKGCAVPWEQALEWLRLEQYSTPALDVKRCRLHATAALAALKAAGMDVVPVEPTQDQDIAGLHAFVRTKAITSRDQVRKIYRAMITAQEG